MQRSAHLAAALNKLHISSLAYYTCHLPSGVAYLFLLSLSAISTWGPASDDTWEACKPTKNLTAFFENTLSLTNKTLRAGNV